ncbi:MAG: phytoene/squalene synthase family protein [Spirochaetales bacterium]|nr:phytoene/squalene synthase family protein [Spirochaetales bacterium]
MKLDAEHREVFKKGSTTYFNSSLFFPPEVRVQVHHLYSFVRVADNYVDCVPQDARGFENFRRAYDSALKGSPSGNLIIDDFIALKRMRQFPDEWVNAFLDAMEADLHKKEYDSVEETLHYVYGSAEVIGLFMASIMDLDEKAFHAARMLGRAMQYINFIRDIDEDLSFGRRYLCLDGTPLKDLSRDYAYAYPDEFSAFVHYHLSLYEQWQKEAEQGYRFIPKRYRIAIKTAGDMYNWTARAIQKDPHIVFEKKCKPKKARIIIQALKNGAAIWFS